MHVQGSYSITRKAEVVVRECMFMQSSKNGVFAGASGAQLHLESCKFKENGGHGVLASQKDRL